MVGKMDLTFLNQTEYLLDVWSKKAADNPSARMLTDERHPHGLSRRDVDDLSGRVYAWLKEKQIGREDFVLLCLPRGAAALISMLGVWKAGAACPGLYAWGMESRGCLYHGRGQLSS